MQNASDHKIPIGPITDKFIMPTDMFFYLQVVFFPLIWEWKWARFAV